VTAQESGVRDRTPFKKKKLKQLNKLTNMN
jgi:hypothetical protein